MNHYPKFSLILLIPFSIIASSPENKNNKGVVFIPKGKSSVIDTSARGMLTSTTQSMLMPRNPVISTHSIDRGTNESSSDSDNNKPEVAQSSQNNNESNDNLVLIHLPAQSENIVNHNELGTPYSIAVAPSQNVQYEVGKDGISKILKLETPSTYIDRLLTSGKFAGAARNSKDSFLPDHLRRTIEYRQEELAKKSNSDKNAIVELLKKQREATTKQFSGLSVLFDATKKHASTDVTLSTIEAFLQQIKSIQENKKILAFTIAQEFAAQDAFLNDLFDQLDTLKKTQSLPITHESNK